MEEFQEADILWPESTQAPRSFVDLQNYLHFASSKNDVVGAIASLSSSASSSSTESSTCTQESDFSCPDHAEDEEECSYFFSAANLTSEEEEKIGCDEDWQEADVLWPDQESPTTKYRDWDEFAAWGPGNCSLGDHEHSLSTKGGARKNISSPIDVPRSKMNYFVHLL